MNATSTHRKTEAKKAEGSKNFPLASGDGGNSRVLNSINLFQACTN